MASRQQPSSYVATVFFLIFLLESSLIFAETSEDETKIFSYEQCREWGFDPSDLSCDTCSLFWEEDGTEPAATSPNFSFHSECRLCCQKWRRNPVLATVSHQQDDQSGVGGRRRSAKYRSAAVLTGRMYVERLSEVKDFLEKDLPDLIERKGEDALEHSSDVHPMQPPTLFFFRGKKERGGPNADEVIHLEKWKRDDIRELVDNLLPDE